MALAAKPLGKVTPPAPEAPKIYGEQFKHSIVDSAWQPEQSILSMVDGIPRRVEYYRQFLNADEAPAPFGKDDAPTYQSYDRIKDMVIKQEGSGSYNFLAESGESTQTFNGWCLFDLSPVVGDVFISDIGDGNAGLFAVIEQPEIRNFTANKVYYLTYQLLGILSEDTYNKLNSRVVRELVYSKDSVLHGGKSVVTTGDYEVTEKLFNWRSTIANYIMRTFYWSPEKTIVWETSAGKKVYDQYLVNFLIAVMPGDLRTTYPFINQFSTEYGGREYGRHGDINIWEVLLRGDFNLLPLCDNKASLVDVNRVVGTRTYGNIRSSKLDYFIATDPERYGQYKAYYNVDGYPILAPSPEHETTYLFSEEFYLGNPTEEFEVLVFDILKNKMVDRRRLLTYCDNYFKLDKQKRLYHGAILLLLLQISRKIGSAL